MDAITPELVTNLLSARTTDRMSGRSGRVEILPRAERRRSWTLAQKEAIVRESLGPDLTPTEVARKHGISTGQIYTWRIQLMGAPGAMLVQTPQFASVEVAPPAAAASSARSASAQAGLIEIALPGGAVVRVDAHVDGKALRRVLGALSER